MQAILNFHWTEKKERELYSSILLSFFIQRELKLLINLINQIKPQADILAYQHLFFSSTTSIQSCPMNILPTLSIFSYKNTHTHIYIYPPIYYNFNFSISPIIIAYKQLSPDVWSV